MARVIVGVFPTRPAAEDAIIALKDAGFDPTRIGFVTRTGHEAQQTAADVGGDAGTGAVTGGILGGALGTILAATGTVVIPGIGPIIAAGILAAAIAGGAAGAIVGGLVGLGVPRAEAEYYHRRLQAGATLVTVDATGQEDEARAILLRHGAEDTWSTTPWSSPAERDNMQAGVSIESARAEKMTPEASPLHRTAPIFPPTMSTPKHAETGQTDETGRPLEPAAPLPTPGAPAHDRGSVVGPGDAVAHGPLTDPYADELEPDRTDVGPISYDEQGMGEPESPVGPGELPLERPE